LTSHKRYHVPPSSTFNPTSFSLFHISSSENKTMKIIALLLTIFAVARAERPAFAPNAALNVRGGALAIGPLDGDMAMQLAKSATIAFAAGSGSKYVATATGGSHSKVSV
jgi:hypothetical protein